MADRTGFIDYEAYDLKSLFSVITTSLLWFDLEHMRLEYRKRVDTLEKELTTDILNGKLKYRSPEDHLKPEEELYKIPAVLNKYTDCLSRDDLRAWATSRGQRPKFLFPEDRGAEVVPQKESILANAEKKPSAPRPNQIIKACCQTVALMLWEQDITLSQKEIVAHPLMQKYGYQKGSFDERTLLLWVSKIDPRPEEVKKTPFRKKEKALDDAL